jgi:plastocyanin
MSLEQIESLYEKPVKFFLIFLLVFSSSILISHQTFVVDASSGSNWTVYVGGGTPDMSVMSMGFFPEVITIDAGDSVTFINNSTEVHTVTFLSGSQSINALSPQAPVPIGGNVYNGTGIVSSGFIMPGQSYTITFTKPGVYIYNCLIHPGMQGVIIVNPAGTPYPYTQAQYNQLAAQQVSQSLSAGESLFQQVNLPAKERPDGTTVWYVDSGFTSPQTVLVQLNNPGGSNVVGSATLTMSNGQMQVQLSLSGVKTGTYSAGIFVGAAEKGGNLLYPLNPITVNSSGIGTSLTTVKVPPSFLYPPSDTFVIPSGGWYINVSDVALGDIINPSSSLMRFLPQTLTITAGDTVVWNQIASDEIHTITFVPQGMPIPEFGTPISLIPSGGNIFNGSGYYNSGPLLPGMSYNLTFVTPGVYTYVCLLHDNMGMYGTIVVLPKNLLLSQNNAMINLLNSSVNNIGSQLNSQVTSINGKLGGLTGQISGLNSSISSLQQSTNNKITSLNTIIYVLLILVIISILLNVVLIARRTR